MVEDVYDQNTSTVAVWSLATSPSYVGIQRGNLTWHKIQPGPIQCLYGPSPLIQPIYIFSMNFLSASWTKPNIAAFLFLAHGLFVSTVSFFFFFSKLGSLVRWVPHCQVLVLGPSHQGNILHFSISRK